MEPFSLPTSIDDQTWVRAIEDARGRLPGERAPPPVEPTEASSAGSTQLWLSGGKPSSAAKLSSNIVRIFSSSTFVDTKAERYVMMELVEPHLSRYAKQFGLSVVVADMRWGIRNEATVNHETINLCLEQIEQCRRTSTGPYFLFFQTARSGYRAPPPQLSLRQMRATRAACSDSPEAIAHLEACYLLEQNSVPPRFRLRSMPEYMAHVREASAGGASSSGASESKSESEAATDTDNPTEAQESSFRAQSNAWWDQQCALLAAVREALRRHEGRRSAGSNPVTGAAGRDGTRYIRPPSLQALETLWESSVTEQEVIQAAAGAERGPESDRDRRRRFAFIRRLRNEDQLTGESLATGKGFVDGVHDREASKARLKVLQQVVAGRKGVAGQPDVQGVFEPGCIFTYDVEFGAAEENSQDALAELEQERIARGEVSPPPGAGAASGAGGSAPEQQDGGPLVTVGVTSHPRYLLELAADMAAALEAALEEEVLQRASTAGVAPSVLGYMGGTEARRRAGEWWDGGPRPAPDAQVGEGGTAASSGDGGLPESHAAVLAMERPLHALQSWQVALGAALSRVTADVMGARQFASRRAQVLVGRGREQQLLLRFISSARETAEDVLGATDGAGGAAVDAAGQQQTAGLPGDPRRPLVVVAPGGSGKSALLAATSIRARPVLDAADASSLGLADGVPTSGTVVSRFCGTSPSTSSARAVLGGIAAHLACSVAIRGGLLPGFGEAADPRLQTAGAHKFRHMARGAIRSWASAARLGDPSKVLESIMQLLALSTAEHPTVIIIDSVDQLAEESVGGSQDVGGAGSEVLMELGWLPKELPPHCRLIVSCLTDATNGGKPRCVRELKRRGVLDTVTPLPMTLAGGAGVGQRARAAPVLLQHVTSEAMVRRTIQDTLSLRQRQLTTEQLETIVAAAQRGDQHPTALLLAMLAGLGARWSCVEPAPPVERLPSDTPAAHRYSVARIAQYHGRGLTLLVMSMLALRPFGDGVSEREILDSLSMDDVLLQRVYQYHHPPTRRIPHLVLVRLLESMGPLLAEREGKGGVPVHCFHHRLLWDTSRRDSLLDWNFSAPDDSDELQQTDTIVADMASRRTADDATAVGQDPDISNAASFRYRAAVLLASVLSGLGRRWFPSRQLAESPDWFVANRYTGHHAGSLTAAALHSDEVRAVPNGRKVYVLPRLLLSLGWWRELAECLTRPSFLAAAVGSGQSAAWELAAVLAAGRKAAAAAPTIATSGGGGAASGAGASSPDSDSALAPPQDWQQWESERRMEGAGTHDPGAGGKLWQLAAEQSRADPSSASIRLLPWERFVNRSAADLARRPWLFTQACLNAGPDTEVRNAIIRAWSTDATGTQDMDSEAAGHSSLRWISVGVPPAGSCLPVVGLQVPPALGPRPGTRVALKLSDPQQPYCLGVAPARSSAWVRGIAAVGQSETSSPRFIALTETGIATVWATGPLRREGELAQVPPVSGDEAAAIAASHGWELILKDAEGTEGAMGDAKFLSDVDLKTWQCGTSMSIPCAEGEDGGAEQVEVFLGGRGDGSVAVWTVEERELVGLSFAGAGSVTAGGSDDSAEPQPSLRLFPEAAGKGYRPTRLWTDHRMVGLVALLPLPGGRLLAASGIGEVGLWQLRMQAIPGTAEKRASLQQVWLVSGDSLSSQKLPVRGLRQLQLRSDTEEAIVCCGDAGVVSVLGLRSGAILGQMSPRILGRGRAFSVVQLQATNGRSADDQQTFMLAVGGDMGYLGVLHGTIYPVGGGGADAGESTPEFTVELRPSSEVQFDQRQDAVMSLEVEQRHGESDVLLAGTQASESGLAVYSAAGGQPLALFSGHGYTVTGVVAIRDGKRLREIVTASADASCRVWAIDEALREAQTAATSPVPSAPTGAPATSGTTWPSTLRVDVGRRPGTHERAAPGAGRLVGSMRACGPNKDTVFLTAGKEFQVWKLSQLSAAPSVESAIGDEMGSALPYSLHCEAVASLPAPLLASWGASYEDYGRRPMRVGPDGSLLRPSGEALTAAEGMVEWNCGTYLSLPIPGADTSEIEAVVSANWCVSTVLHNGRLFPQGGVSLWGRQLERPQSEGASSAASSNDTTSWKVVCHEWRLEGGVVGGDAATGERAKVLSEALGVAVPSVGSIVAIVALASTCGRVLLRRVVRREEPSEGGDGGIVPVFDLEVIGELDTRPHHNGKQVRDVQISPSATAIAAGCTDGGISIWRISPGGGLPEAPAVVAHGHTGFVRSVAWGQIYENQPASRRYQPSRLDLVPGQSGQPAVGGGGAGSTGEQSGATTQEVPGVPMFALRREGSIPVASPRSPGGLRSPMASPLDRSPVTSPLAAPLAAPLGRSPMASPVLTGRADPQALPQRGPSLSRQISNESALTSDSGGLGRESSMPLLSLDEPEDGRRTRAVEAVVSTGRDGLVGLWKWSGGKPTAGGRSRRVAASGAGESQEPAGEGGGGGAVGAADVAGAGTQDEDRPVDPVVAGQRMRRRMVPVHDHIAWCVRASPSGRYVATVSEDSTLSVVEVSSGNTVATHCQGASMRAVEWVGEHALLAATTNGELVPIVLADSGS